MTVAPMTATYPRGRPFPNSSPETNYMVALNQWIWGGFVLQQTKHCRGQKQNNRGRLGGWERHPRRPSGRSGEMGGVSQEEREGPEMRGPISLGSVEATEGEKGKT